MRKSLLALAIGAAMASPLTIAPLAVAQDSAGYERGEFREKHRRAHFADRLNLTEEQREQMRELRDSGASKEELRSVLTDEQQAEMDQMRENRSDRRQQMAARMQSHLELTDAQAAEIQEIRENGGTREDVRAVLTDEQREKMDAMHARRGERKSYRRDSSTEQY